MPYIREYQITEDQTLRCIPLSLGGLQRVQSDFARRRPAPLVPTIKVEIAGNETEELNPEDPAYVAALAEWKNELNVTIMKYAFSTCILDKPPAEFIDIQRAYFGADELTLPDLVYMWLTSLANDESTLADLSEFIMGSALPTSKGIEQAEDSFQGDSGRDTGGQVDTAAQG